MRVVDNERLHNEGKSIVKAGVKVFNSYESLERALIAAE